MKLRERGWLSDDDVELMKSLADQIPPPSDIVRLMVRDVEDQSIVRGFNLDSEFQQKYTGQLQKWGQANGFSDELMLRYWRAHWSVPSATQLYEMLHRLRPDKYGNQKDASGFPLAITLDDVRLALGQNDVAPFWRDKLAAISYRPMRLVDARRSYLANNISDGQLKSFYQDLGQESSTAQNLVTLARRLKRDAARKHPEISAYIRGQQSEQTTRFVMSQDGYDFLTVDDAIAYANRQQQRNAQAKCLAAIRKQYLSGLISDIDLPRTLGKLSLSLGQIQTYVNQWGCEKTIRNKHLSASVLCKLHGNGQINNQQYAQYLVNVGYTVADANALVGLCVAGEQEKAAKAAKRKK